MKKESPLPPKIGYYVGSIIIFIAWFFSNVTEGWNIVLNFFKISSPQKQHYSNYSTAYNNETNKWFFGETSNEQEQSLERANLHGDA